MAIFHSRGAVESRDSVAIILGVLEKLCYIISGDNTDGNVAGGDHFDVFVGRNTTMNLMKDL